MRWSVRLRRECGTSPPGAHHGHTRHARSRRCRAAVPTTSPRELKTCQTRIGEPRCRAKRAMRKPVSPLHTREVAGSKPAAPTSSEARYGGHSAFSAASSGGAPEGAVETLWRLWRRALLPSPVVDLRSAGLACLLDQPVSAAVLLTPAAAGASRAIGGMRPRGACPRSPRRCSGARGLETDRRGSLPAVSRSNRARPVPSASGASPLRGGNSAGSRARSPSAAR